ncbi:MAG: ATP-grasp domain-containing protein [Kiritimatiellaeota bacterium]|nr:ATP-grasp domain-containing protein [Kiritimatiellota bacterium]
MTGDNRPLTPYTTTLLDAARRRGIRVRIINPDPDLPVFDLSRGGRTVRCFNALTDLVGAATYHLVNNKRACHHWLAARRIPVPAQIAYDDACPARAAAFLAQYAPIVVKPCMQWGGRGVSMGVRTAGELAAAVRFARRYEPDVILEETVPGDDLRVILAGGELAAAIRRNPASVVGDGHRTIRQLIARRNALRRKADPSNLIPWDAETRRNLAELGRRPDDVPHDGECVRVRLTNNYHTGGQTDVVTDAVPRRALALAQRIARALALPLVGVDFLIDPATRRMTVIEVSPDMAISPPEGDTVAERFLDTLFGA